MKIVGLDLSLTSTGVAVILDTPDRGRWASVDRIQTKPGRTDLVARHARLWRIAANISSWTDGADLVVVEGLAYAARSPHTTERAGLWWLVVDRLLRWSDDVAVVPPSSRAKYATGKGNAPKDAVLAAVIRRYPTVDVTGNDEADALTLAAMGARHLGHPIDDGLPAVNLAAMNGATWPDFDVTARQR